jgi:tetratricopeptide (TPR) repeat protein
MKSRAKEFLERARREMQHAAGADALGLDGLEALADYFEGDSSKALERLADKTDPQSIRSKLAILIRLNRFRDAVDSINNLPPHEKWCDLAVTAFVGHDERQKALHLVNWAGELPDPVFRRKCLLAYADSALVRALKQREPGSHVHPGTISREERSNLQDAEKHLRPLLQTIISEGRVNSPFDEITVIQGLKLYYLMADWEHLKELVPLLAKRRPVPIEFARMFLWHGIAPSDEIVRTLRADHPNAFEPRLIAALIEGERLEHPQNGFDAALTLIPLAQSNGERERLYFALLGMSQSLNGECVAKLREIAPQLLQHDPRLLSLAQAGLALKVADLEMAEQALNAAKNEGDVRWLQMRAAFLVQSGNIDSAIDTFKKAAAIAQHPDLFQVIAELAYGQSRFSDVKHALQQALLIDPRNLTARKNLASLQAQLDEFADAAEQFRILCEQFPEQQIFWLNRAICLARSNAFDDSLLAYDRACAFEKPPLEAIAGRAELLRAQGRCEDGFESLASFKEPYWSDYRFLLGYMELGYAAGKDDEAHQAFQRLRELRSESKVPDETMKEWSLEQLVELMGEDHKRHTAVHKDLLQGKMSWLLIDTASRRGAYWGWRLRTQKLDWIGDDPVNRSEYCIYATNSFHPMVESEGLKRMEPLQCPPKGTEVVCDLSALITLHRLGLLDQAAAHFGRIMIPAAYLSYALQESLNLVLHQRSQLTSVEQVRDAIDAGRIGVMALDEHIPTVDEHSTEDENVPSQFYRLRDVATGLQGRVPDAQLQDLLGIAHRCARTDPEHAPLPAGGRVGFSLSTLGTLVTRGLFDAVLNLYSVMVSAEDRDEAMAHVRALRLREEVREWHADLWKRVRNDQRFIQMAHPPHSSRREEAGGHRDVAFAALLLARERDLPLLVDDRMVQAVLMNERAAKTPSAFGTDTLIANWVHTGALPATTGALSFEKLVEWRYRFLVPPPTVLKALADRFKTHPPGKALQMIALYAHDCMNDPGIFGGPEPTEPPIPIALILFQSWVAIIAEFIVEMWQDEEYSDEAASTLTKWAITELLPSPSLNIPGRLQSSTAAVASHLLLGRAMIRSATAENVDRANQALRSIAEAFHLDEAQYLEIVTGVIDASDRE